MYEIQEFTVKLDKIQEFTAKLTVKVKLTVNLTVTSCIMQIQNPVKLQVIFYSVVYDTTMNCQNLY